MTELTNEQRTDLVKQYLNILIIAEAINSMISESGMEPTATYLTLAAFYKGYSRLYYHHDVDLDELTADIDDYLRAGMCRTFDVEKMPIT